MRTLRLSLSLFLSTWLILSPVAVRSDAPIGTAIVVVGIPMAAVIGTAVVAQVLDSSSKTETKETDTSDSETSSSSSSEDTGRDTGDGGGDAGSDNGDAGGQSGAVKPKINIHRSTFRGWFEGDETRSLYTSRIPGDMAPSAGAASRGAKAARKRSVRGVGVAYSDTTDKANVMLAPSSVKRVDFTTTRRTVFKLTRKGGIKKELSYPVRLKVEDLTVSTTDIPETIGEATGRVVLRVENEPVYTLRANVLQGQLPTITGDLQEGEATVVQQNDLASIKGLDKVIRVKFPKGKRSITVVLVVETSGTGRKAA